MSESFREALLWHMEKEATTITDLVAGTGVSRDVVNKLRAREGSTTTVENALMIAAFYGKTVNQFVNREPAPQEDIIQALIGLLSDAETRELATQIRSILSDRKL